MTLVKFRLLFLLGIQGIKIIQFIPQVQETAMRGTLLEEQSALIFGILDKCGQRY